MRPSATVRGLKRGSGNSAVERNPGSTKLASATPGSLDNVGFAGWGGVCGVLTLVVFSALLLGAVQPAHGQTETVLYSFCARPNCTDGAGPSWVTPVFDGEGNLYGTTLVGGAYSCNHGGCGTVFELTPSGTETILHSFDRCETDGFWPNPGLVRDAEGNIYGTTSAGGAYSYGTVFKVTPSGTETILHSFDPNGTDGWVPAAGLVFDKKAESLRHDRRGRRI